MFPHELRTKKSLTLELDKWEEVGVTEGTLVISKRDFTQNVVDNRKSLYGDVSSIYRCQRMWKKTRIVPAGRGPPTNMVLNDIVDAIKETLKDCASDSSAFRLEDMKCAYVVKKKQKVLEDSLEPENIQCGVSDQTAKIAMIAAAMGNTGLTFSKKKLLLKTDKRFQAEHSVMGVYAFATTVLSTHFIDGPIPHNLHKFFFLKCSVTNRRRR